MWFWFVSWSEMYKINNEKEFMIEIFVDNISILTNSKNIE